MPEQPTDQAASFAKSKHPKLEAFLTRVMLRLFNDSPGLSSYYDTSGVRADGTLVVIMYELPNEVLPAVYQAIGCEDITVYKFGEGQQIKLMYEIKPKKEEMADLKLYPDSESDEEGKDEVPEPA